MADSEIIDATAVPVTALQLAELGVKDQYGYTQEQRGQSLQLLIPSLSDVVLGAGWDILTDMLPSESEVGTASSFSSSPSDTGQLPGTSSSCSSSTSATHQEETFSEALLVRSCSQGWSLSFELHSAYPVPKLSSPAQVLVRNSVVGLNPVDWKSVSFNFGIAGFPWVLGRDIAGTVLAVGEDVTHLRAGDRVWTCADSRDSNAGGYQRISVHNAQTVANIPDNLTDEQAATLGTGLVTAAVVLYCCFGLPIPSLEKSEREQYFCILSSRAMKKRRTNTSSSETTALETRDGNRPRYVLIYGGGAITGIYAAQLARLSGLKVISVASPSNFDYLKSLGVAACVDRTMAEASILSRIDEIVDDVHGTLLYAVDCVSSSTANICWRALASETERFGPSAKCEMVCLAGDADPASLSLRTMQGTIKIHKISFSTTFYSPSHPFARNMIENMTAFLTAGRLQPCRANVIPDGLAGIRHGLEQLREGKAPRARKLVVRIDETPSADITLLGVRSELSWNGAV